MRYGIVRYKQAVGVFILLCICLSRCHLRHELVGVHRSCVGKGNIVQGAVCLGAAVKGAVHRAGNIHR